MFLSHESARLVPAMQRFAPRGVQFDSWATDNGDGTDNPDPFGGGSVNDGAGVDTSYTGGVDTSQTYNGPDSSGSYAYDSTGAYTGDQSGGNYGSAPTPVDTSGGSGGGSFAGGGLNASYSTMTDPAYNDANNPYGPVTYNSHTGTYYQGGEAVGTATPGQPGHISSSDYGTGIPWQEWGPTQVLAMFDPTNPRTWSGAPNPFYGATPLGSAPYEHYFGSPGAPGWAMTGQVDARPGHLGNPPTMGGPAATSFNPNLALRLPAQLPFGTVSGVFRDQSLGAAPTPTTNAAGVPTSQNGQSLFDQPQDVQEMFTGTYGDNAAAEWARENDASLSASLPQGAQLPQGTLPGQNPGNRDQWWNDQGANPVVAPVGPQAGAPPPVTPPATPAGPPAQTPPASPPGTTDVALPDGTIVHGLTPAAAAALNKVLEAQSKTAADETQYKRSQDALANQRANQQLDLQRARDSAQAAYQQALIQKQTEAQAQQAAYQALMAELERQRIEQQGQANQQASAYQQAQLAQNRQQEANRVSLEREKTDLQRRLLPTTRLARRGTTVQIT